jgi:small subunit ribosomal protein S6
VTRTSSYELMVIMYPDISDEDRQAFQSKLEQEITSNGGHLTNLEVWGKRTLAYEIQHRTEGYYLLVHFDMPRKAVKAVHQACLLDPRVLRHKVFRLDLPRVAPAGGSD